MAVVGFGAAFLIRFPFATLTVILILGSIMGAAYRLNPDWPRQFSQWLGWLASDIATGARERTPIGNGSWEG